MKLLTPPYYLAPCDGAAGRHKPLDMKSRRRSLGQARKLGESIGQMARGARRRAERGVTAAATTPAGRP